MRWNAAELIEPTSSPNRRFACNVREDEASKRAVPAYKLEHIKSKG